MGLTHTFVVHHFLFWVLMINIQLYIYMAFVSVQVSCEPYFFPICISSKLLLFWSHWLDQTLSHYPWNNSKDLGWYSVQTLQLEILQVFSATPSNMSLIRVYDDIIIRWLTSLDSISFFPVAVKGRTHHRSQFHFHHPDLWFYESWQTIGLYMVRSWSSPWWLAIAPLCQECAQDMAYIFFLCLLSCWPLHFVCSALSTTPVFVH